MLFESVSIFFLSAVLVWIVRHYAPVLGLVDVPNARSTHNVITPRGGGIGFLLSLFLLFPFFHPDLLLQYKWTFAAILMVFLTGILDDHHDTSPKTKFIVIFIATVFLDLDGIVINELGSFFGKNLTLGWLALPFTMFAVSGFTNASNLIDGLDGLSSSIGIIIFGAFMLIGYQHYDLFLFTLSGCFIAALSAFLLFNWYPASIFMGDSGSLTVGFVISVLAIKALAYIPTVSVLFIAAVPILDTLTAMIRRKLSGRSAFSADRCHVHHIVKHFFSENTRKTVFALGMLQLVYSLTGLQMNKNTDEGFLLVLFLLNVVLFYLFLAAMIKRQKQEC
ncbi:Undecaprenyl-phosphate N-acetylglucosaminyl 1-phosphate transferase [hydrothermal vent metagenome]|uniref:Undecaprenyl-phosphate N-acetylglucosaminyl 1-phosphate transferase n=1 Tax=hydrothermal vent metagenome TaxID=652676 RepID=A0A1W1CJ28_9ZZZZ